MFQILPLLTPEQAARFWAKVEKTDTCWLWRGSKSRFGYGVKLVDGERYLTHRLSWRMANPKHKLPIGMVIRHSCDVPQCVNPAHLDKGTYADNAEDARVRGRLRAGERSPVAKATEAVVREIRGRVAAGESKRAIAGEFGLARGTVRFITQGHTWKSAGGPIEPRPACTCHSGRTPCKRGQ